MTQTFTQIREWAEPPVIKVGKWEFPKPITVAPAKGTIYWVATMSPIGYAPDYYVWDDDDADSGLLEHHMIHLSEAAAQAHADVLNAICRGDID